MGMLSAEQYGGKPVDESQTAGPPASPQGKASTPMASGPAPEGTGTPDEQALIQKGVKLLYDERFDKLMKMFEANGAERFGESMSTAINTVISELEKEAPLPPETAAKVGMELFSMLTEDVLSSGDLQGVGEQQISQALGKTLDMYAKTHKDTVSPEDMQQLASAMESEQQASPGAPPPRQAAAPTLGVA